jgi:hypothetical protein
VNAHAIEQVRPPPEFPVIVFHDEVEDSASRVRVRRVYLYREVAFQITLTIRRLIPMTPPVP